MFRRNERAKTGVLDGPETRKGEAKLDNAFERLGQVIFRSQAVSTGDPVLKQEYEDRYGVGVELPVAKPETVQPTAEGARPRSSY